MLPSRDPSPRTPLISTRASSRSGYNSRAPSRPRASRNSSRASLAYLPQGGEDLILPDGPIGEGAAELLQEFVNPHHDRSYTLVEDREDEASDDASDVASVEQRKKLPWYKRPSPLWSGHHRQLDPNPMLTNVLGFCLWCPSQHRRRQRLSRQRSRSILNSRARRTNLSTGRTTVLCLVYMNSRLEVIDAYNDLDIPIDEAPQTSRGCAQRTQSSKLPSQR